MAPETKPAFKRLKENELDWRMIKDDFDTLIEGTELQLERQWPKHLAAFQEMRETFVETYRVCRWSFKACQFLCGETPYDPIKKSEFLVGVPVMARSIVDSLFNIVFISEDPGPRSLEFYRGGYARLRGLYERNKSRYGDEQSWQDWFREGEYRLGVLRKTAQLGPNDVAKTWPTPGTLLKNLTKDENKEFLQHIHDWFYREMSGTSHRDFQGLTEAAFFLQHAREGTPVIVGNYRAKVFRSAFVLMLVVISEFFRICKFVPVKKLHFIWAQFVLTGDEDGTIIYNTRYKKALAE